MDERTNPLAAAEHMSTVSEQTDRRLRRAAVVVSIIVSTVLIGLKLTVWILSDAVTLLSSLLDSSLDLISTGITAFGIYHATQPADREHRFGHGKAEPSAALVQSIFIGASALIILFESIKRLVSPEPVDMPLLAMGAMVFSITLVLGQIAFQTYVVRKTGSLSIKAETINRWGDVLAGLVIVAALGMTAWTGFTFIDPLIALGIAGFLLYNAKDIAADALAILMDAELNEADRKRIRETAMAHPKVRGLHDLRTRHTGTGVMIEIHLEMDGDMSLYEAHEIADDVEKAVMALFVDAQVIVHQDPYGLREDRLDAALATDG